MLVAARHGRTNARMCDVNATPSAWSRRTTGSFRASARREECGHGSGDLGRRFVAK
jgi:hypothetical protein